ncbi:MAG TPA: SDR family oxidoreductase [Pseudoduganella sp.]|jgi:NAD(P)-dependent dehydrogenase (short-subunit alcohol dehydrogenase family)
MALPSSLPAGTRMLAADTFASDVVLVTEAGGTLAMAAAVEFARAGARVALTFRPDGSAPDLTTLRELAPRALCLPCDASDAAAVASLFDTVTAELGPVSILLNHHGAASMAAAEHLPLQDWHRATSRVLDAAFVCSTEFARRRIAARAGGAILNLVDTMAWNGGPALAHAATASAAVLNLTKTLAVEWGPDNIRVNAIAPGPFARDGSAGELLARTQGRDRARTLPAMRLGEPQEFGWTATFLCSRYSAYTSGAVFVIDGGEYLRRSLSGAPFVAPRDLAAAVACT